MDWNKLALQMQGFAEGYNGRGQEFLQNLDERRKQALIQDSLAVKNALVMGKPDEAVGLLNEREDLIKKLAGDPSDTVQLRQKIESGDMEGALKDVSTVINYAKEAGLMGDPRQVQSSNILPGGLVQVVYKDGSTEIRMPSDDEIAQIRDSEERGIDLSARRERARAEARGEVKITTEAQILDLARQAKRGELRDAAQQDILNNHIDLGIKAHELLPSVERGLELIDKVETGGLAKWRKSVTDFFGDTPADVGELNNILAQNVLEALNNFSGALSDRELEFVADIETNLGQGKAVNKRMLQSAKRLLQRKIERARKAAKLSGDDFTLDMLNTPVGVGSMRSSDQPAAPTSLQPSGKIEFMGFENE